MDYITIEELMRIIEISDKENNIDLESFLLKMSKKAKRLPNDMLENIVDLLKYEHQISCDADLYKLSLNKLRELVKDINKLARDYRVDFK